MGKYTVKDRYKIVGGSVDSSRVTFSDSDDEEERVVVRKGTKAMAAESEAQVHKVVKSTFEDEDNDQPEEVSKFDDELQRLKELHEQSQSLSVRDRKKRQRAEKEKAEAKAAKEAAQTPLDPSILAEVAAEAGSGEGGNEDDIDVVDSNDGFYEEENEEGNGLRIDVNKRPTKIFDNIEVTTLDDADPQDNFRVSNNVKAFLDSQSSRHGRVDYSSFSRQKKPQPATRFATGVSSLSKRAKK